MLPTAHIMIEAVTIVTLVGWLVSLAVNVFDHKGLR